MFCIVFVACMCTSYRVSDAWRSDTWWDILRLILEPMEVCDDQIIIGSQSFADDVFGFGGLSLTCRLSLSLSPSKE